MEKTVSTLFSGEQLTIICKRRMILWRVICSDIERVKRDSELGIRNRLLVYVEMSPYEVSRPSVVVVRIVRFNTIPKVDVP